MKSSRHDGMIQPVLTGNMPRWHNWIARAPPKGEVTGSIPVRGTIYCSVKVQRNAEHSENPPFSPMITIHVELSHRHTAIQ